MIISSGCLTRQHAATHTLLSAQRIFRIVTKVPHDVNSQRLKKIGSVGQLRQTLPAARGVICQANGN